MHKELDNSNANCSNGIPSEEFILAVKSGDFLPVDQNGIQATEEDIPEIVAELEAFFVRGFN